MYPKFSSIVPALAARLRTSICARATRWSSGFVGRGSASTFARAYERIASTSPFSASTPRVPRSPAAFLAIVTGCTESPAMSRRRIHAIAYCTRIGMQSMSTTPRVTDLSILRSMDPTFSPPRWNVLSADRGSSSSMSVSKRLMSSMARSAAAILPSTPSAPPNRMLPIMANCMSRPTL